MRSRPFPTPFRWIFLRCPYITSWTSAHFESTPCLNHTPRHPYRNIFACKRSNIHSRENQVKLRKILFNTPFLCVKHQFLFASSWPKLLTPRPSNTTKIEKMNNLQKIVNVASKSVLCSTYPINELILHKFVLFSQSLHYRYTSSSSSKGSASSYFRK